MITTGFNSKMSNLKSTGAVKHGFWDALVFNKIKAAFGGHIRIMVTGSAPITPEV